MSLRKKLDWLLNEQDEGEDMVAHFIIQFIATLATVGAIFCAWLLIERGY